MNRVYPILAGLVLTLILAAAARGEGPDPLQEQFDQWQKLIDRGTGQQTAGQLPQALDSYKQSLGLAHIMQMAAPDDLRAQQAAALSYRLIASDEAESGDPADAFDNFKNSMQISVKLVTSQPPEQTSRRDLSAVQQAFKGMGDTLVALGRDAEALHCYGQECETLKMLAGGDDLQAKLALAVCYRSASQACAKVGQLNDAIAAGQASVEICAPLYKANPTDDSVAIEWFLSNQRLGLQQTQAGKFDPAIAHLQAAVDAITPLARADHKDAWRQNAQREGRLQLGEALEKAQKLDAALVQFQTAVVLDEARVTAANKDLKLQRDLWASDAALSRVQAALRHYDEAIISGLAARQVAEKIAAADPKDADAAVGVANWDYIVGMDYESLGSDPDVPVDQRRHLLGQAQDCFTASISEVHKHSGENPSSDQERGLLQSCQTRIGQCDDVLKKLGK